MSFDYEAYDEFFADIVKHSNTNVEALSLGEIGLLEKRINRYIPLAVRAYLCQIGIALQNWAIDHYEIDIEATTLDIISAKSWENNPYRCIDIDNPSILPVMDRYVIDEIFFVIVTQNDPSVYWFAANDESYQFVNEHFTLFVRESLINHHDYWGRSRKVLERIRSNNKKSLRKIAKHTYN